MGNLGYKLTSVIMRPGSNMLVATYVTKSTVGVKILADLRVPLDAVLCCAQLFLANFIDMLFSAVLTKFAIACLEVFAGTCLHFRHNRRSGDDCACFF